MRKISLFIYVILFSFSINAQLLWKISGNGLKNHSYLFGTNNLIPIQFFDSVPGLYRAFNSSEVVIGEMIANNVDATAKIQQAAIMPNHIKLKDLLSQEEQSLVDSTLKSTLKIGIKELNMMNPTLILSIYKMEIFKKITGFSDDLQSDSYFQLVATEKDKKVIGLETVEQQINVLFGNASLQQQADILVESIKKSEQTFSKMLQSNKLYRAGKIDELAAEFQNKNSKNGDESLIDYDKKMDNRNSDWVTKLPSYFHDFSCFVAVDALHLGGQNGLVKLLQKKGYKVTPILN